MNIQAKNLSKSFGNKAAVKDLSIDIKEGQVLGLLGPNGAGKSTTIKMLSGQIAPSSGTIVIDGKEYSRVPDTFRGKIGVMPQEVVIWDNLNIEENLLYTATLQEVDNKIARKRADYLIEALHLKKELDTLARDLSGGYKRRLNLAISIIHDPSLLFLDEPTPGIDAQSRRFLMDYIKELADTDDYAIVLTDHYLDEAEKLSDYVVIIDDGGIVAQGTVPQLKKQHGDGSILVVDLDESLDKKTMDALTQEFKQNFKHEIRRTNHTLATVADDPLKAMQTGIAALNKHNLNALNISVKEPTLEDIFLLLTGREIRE